MSQSDYTHDRKWQDQYTQLIMSTLKPLTPHCVELSIAPVEEDNKHATDYVVTMGRGSIAVRLRRPFYEQRDLTIRSRRDNGKKTELAKIKEGYAFRYFYGWTDKNLIPEWMLVDLDKLRQSGLLEKRWREYPNRDKHGEPDGTWFIAIPCIVLEKAGCIIKHQLKPQIFKLQRATDIYLKSDNKVQAHLNKKFDQDNLWGELA